MCLIPLSSICHPYRNQSNNPITDEGMGTRQPLLDTAQADS